MATDTHSPHVGGAMTALERFMEAEVRWVDLGATKLAYRRFGRGPVVVMVHGWPLAGVTYRGLVDALAADFTCIVPDLPGAGDSPWAPATRDIFTDFAPLVLRFVDALRLDRFSLIGHDSGGAIARIVAAEAPARVCALALTNTEVPGHTLALVRAFQVIFGLPGAGFVFRQLLRSRWFVRSRFGFGGAFGDRSRIDGEFDRTAIEPLRRDPSRAILGLRNADLSIADRLHELHARITAPLLCVWGDRDPFFPIEYARAMVEAWPTQAHLERVEGMKLLVHEEAPARVAALMRPFLMTHSGVRLARSIPA